MRILLTNDDGISAPGLLALAEALHAAGHCLYVCAPHVERSGASHSIAIDRPLRAAAVPYPHALNAWQVEGTPADCASLGLYLTREDPVDMVIAGINRGMNLGGACVYSGTVAAAMEGAMGGVQALAVSLHIDPADPHEDYAAAARLAVRVSEWMRSHPLPRGCIYNLNVPSLPYGEIRGLVPARLAPVFLSKPDYRKVSDEKGDSYRFVYHKVPLNDPEFDMCRIQQGYATITKLTWDMRMPGNDDELLEIGL